MYLLVTENGKALFTGDCLFLGGVGQFLEGTAAEFTGTLRKISGEISDDTLLFYGHNYGRKNLEWANQFMQERDEAIKTSHARVFANFEQKILSTGLSFGDEKRHSLFFRSLLAEDQ